LGAAVSDARRAETRKTNKKLLYTVYVDIDILVLSKKVIGG